MNTLRVNYSSIASADFFPSLGKVLGAEPSGSLLQIPSFNGNGSISYKEIDKGLLLLSSDIKLSKDLLVSKMGIGSEVNGQTFIISYLAGNPQVYVSNMSGKRMIKRIENDNILFFSADANIKFEIPAGETIKLIYLSINAAWLKKNRSDEDPGFVNYIEDICEKKQSPAVVKSFPLAHGFAELGQLLTKPVTGISLKFKALSLIADFFSDLYYRDVAIKEGSRIVPDKKMQQVETILKQYLQSKLPDTEAIARQVAMSASTLKRHFKATYSKNIYEYYLELKMEYARHLLTDKTLSVNEVAYMLGYEKASNFIDTFKKYQGFSPGSLKKKTA